MRCSHLGAQTELLQTPAGEEARYACAHPRHRQTTLADCSACPDFHRPAEIPMGNLLPATSPTPGRHPAGVVVDRHHRPVEVADLWLGASAFLVLGGPSLKTQPLEQLARRGCLVLSVNNCPAALPPGVRPHVWLHSDPTHKFHGSLWRDPGVLKFSPVREWEAAESESRRPPTPRHKAKGIRRRAADGALEFVPGLAARNCPGTLGYHRNSTFDPAAFLTEPHFNRGNDKASAYGEGAQRGNGHPHCINTVFTALRLAHHLGIGRLYLLGADFRMTDERPYAFEQGKHAGGVRSNNDAYAKICVMLDLLQPRFLAAGFQVFNATPGSNLWTFPVIDFEKALDEATGALEQELDCRGWYDDLAGHVSADAGS